MGVEYKRQNRPFDIRIFREEGKALVTQATDEQSQQTNAVTYIQVQDSNWQQLILFL